MYWAWQVIRLQLHGSHPVYWSPRKLIPWLSDLRCCHLQQRACEVWWPPHYCGHSVAGQEPECWCPHLCQPTILSSVASHPQEKERTSRGCRIDHSDCSWFQDGPWCRSDWALTWLEWNWNGEFVTGWPWNSVFKEEGVKSQHLHLCSFDLVHVTRVSVSQLCDIIVQ